MKGYSSLSKVIDRGGGCRSEEKGWKAVKEQIRETKKSKRALSKSSRSR